MNAAAFLRQAVQHPASTGAVAPSSKRLAQLMVKHADLEGAATVVELGPGTGAITKEILSAVDGKSRFLGVERNLQFLICLKKHFAQRGLHQLALCTVMPKIYLRTSVTNLVTESSLDCLGPVFPTKYKTSCWK